MNSIKLNHWYVNDSELAISLMRFYVGIKIFSENNDVCYNVRVINSNTEIKVVDFKFSTLENAITFTEGIVAYCSNIDEVIDKYNVFCENSEKTYKKKR